MGSINPRHLWKLSLVLASQDEIELMAALGTNGIRVDLLSDHELAAICRDAERLREAMEAAEQKQFTFYDMMRAYAGDLDVMGRENFESETDWYDNIVDAAMKQRNIDSALLIAYKDGVHDMYDNMTAIIKKNQK